MRIDSHQHFWKYDPTRQPWINEEMKVIQKNFLPEDLFPILAQHEIAGCVAVQADESIRETAFLCDLASGSITGCLHRREFADLFEAVNSFQNTFKEAVGYTWKNRATCKPKKGSALVVDLDTLSR